MISIAAALLAAGCVTYESEYERAVYDAEPVYCYRTLGAVDCYRKPNARDHRQLMNYYGPAPGKYRVPPAPSMAELQPPAAVDTRVRAADPDGDDLPPRASTSNGSLVVAAPGAVQPAAAVAEPPEKDEEWRSWLPVVSVLFGAAQAVAAFVF